MTSIKEKIKAYDIMMQKRIDKKDYIKIYRTFKRKEKNLDGFLLLISKRFLLIQLQNDFAPDGYAIIRKNQFDSLQFGRNERTISRIYKEEKILNEEVINKHELLRKSVSLKSWEAIFEDLKKFDYHVIIECENKKRLNFFIGPIKQIGDKKISIQYYDPTGQLEDDVTTIKYSDITIVQFGDRYSTIFRKYLKPAKENK